MKFRYALQFVALLVLLIGMGCSRRYHFEPADPDVQKFIQAIESFRDSHGQLPADLGQLVPDYLNSLERPDDVEEILYEVDSESESWRLTFVGKLNTRFTYDSRTGGGDCRTPKLMNVDRRWLQRIVKRSLGDAVGRKNYDLPSITHT